MIIAVAASLVFLAGQVMAEPITINWWHAMKGARGKVVDNMIKVFNDSQSDYVVVGTYKGNYDETVNAGVAAYRARKQPHLLQSFEVGTQTMMLSGAIYPVYKLMKDEGYNINWKGYLQPVLSYYMNANGDLMSMPFNSSTPVMYYNVDLFKKAGIPMLDKTTPVTWDELGKITAKLVKSGVPGGMVTGWQSWTQVENYSAIHNIAFASKANGYEGLDCELLINNPTVVKHVAMLKKWMKDGRFFYGGQKFAGPKAEFLAQNAGVYGIAAFMKHLGRQDMQIYWHKNTGYFPITLAAYEQLKKDGYYKEQPYQEVGIKQLTRKEPTKVSRGLRLGYFIQIRNIINEELELVWNDTKTPQEAMDNAVKRSNQQLREFEKIYK
ncbi:MAG: extracellular solute-binding protein [Deltaproteobacteria bacterium]|nr:extracellular solute-binding protein [Deltaproteobacteria bacterium]